MLNPYADKLMHRSIQAEQRSEQYENELSGASSARSLDITAFRGQNTELKRSLEKNPEKREHSGYNSFFAGLGGNH